MEKDFYTDDFEQLLKDTTDDFRMYPSRKVWHSIYNDMHPARKWPSFAVCLLLISSILYIGIHNNNTINADAENLLFSSLSPSDNENKNFSSAFLPVAVEDKKAPAAASGIKTKNGSLPNNKDQNSVSNSSSPGTVSNLEESTLPATKLSLIPGEITFSQVPYTRIVKDKTEHLTIDAAPIIADPYNGKPGAIISNDVASNEANEVASSLPAKEISLAIGTDEPALADDKKVAAQSIAPAAKIRDAEQTAWMEDYAFHNKRNSNKWKTKLSTVTYFTPSVGYRILNKNNHFEPVNSLLIRNNATSVDADNSINKQAALNMESGASVLMDLSKNFRIKAGVQFNYTNYISFAQKLSHPTQTNILLNDLHSGNTMLVPYSTMYGNKPGSNLTRLNNKTIQFSFPVGADIKLLGNDKIKWYAGATIQPTYVAGGNAYLISADYKNYIDVPSMLRKWNLNTGVESFISYKTKNGTSINLGPQFRYQLLSTYGKQYTYTEKLYNVGIKAGITRKL